MGNSVAMSTRDISMEDDDKSYSDDINGYCLSNVVINNELLSYILSFVRAKDLVINCRLVCKSWKQILDEEDVWRIKCTRQGIIIPREFIQNVVLPRHFYRTIVFKRPYYRNLIRNPCGDEGMRYWHYTEGGDGWKIEKPPNGADDFNSDPELTGITRCFATSYRPCVKWQVIDLLAEGCHSEILDNHRPKIHISDWYCGRFDCACRYELHVIMKDGFKNVMKQFDFGPAEIPQWTGKSWIKVKHVLEDYKPGLRYIEFRQMGSDLQFWAGHYGSKMTNSRVEIKLD